MIVRLIAIALAALGFAGLWFGYDQLGIFRRTVFWEFRYIIFSAGAFLGLSILEWVFGWIKGKIEGEPETH